MELLLNLVWVLLAVVIVRLWSCHATQRGASRRSQFAAVAMLILILFPVISVTDDLQATQNLTEDDVYLRRGHTTNPTQPVFSSDAVLPSAIFELPVRYQRMDAPSLLPVPNVNKPSLSSIQSRPPPSA
jgi:hypothetical protein